MIRTFLCLAGLFAAVAIVVADDVTLDNLKSKTPDSWKAEKPSNKFRAYQFSLP